MISQQYIELVIAGWKSDSFNGRSGFEQRARSQTLASIVKSYAADVSMISRRTASAPPTE